ncbi:MAG: TRAP transporter TatT component family protein [Desulfobulbaceae bacterium]|nr:TRAP transporter TatT component family protein [Desulfobulbaceae bacterium]
MKILLFRIITLAAVLAGLSGCARLAVNSLVGPTIDNLQRQTDLDLVCEGTSSFLLMLDSMIASDPDNSRLLMTGAQSYAAYAAALDVCGRPERAAAVSVKAKDYGLALLSDQQNPALIKALDPSALNDFLAGLDGDDTAKLFWTGNGWATWIRFQEGSPAALADLIRVEQIMLRVVELDETFYHGGAHLFLGAYYGAKPPMLGGKLAESRAHFEKALALSSREYLPTQVAYAQVYATMTYDRDLYVKLLQEVMDFPLGKRPDIALANQAAKRMASRMLSQVDRYF